MFFFFYGKKKRRREYIHTLKYHFFCVKTTKQHLHTHSPISCFCCFFFRKINVLLEACNTMSSYECVCVCVRVFCTHTQIKATFACIIFYSSRFCSRSGSVFFSLPQCRGMTKLHSFTFAITGGKKSSRYMLYRMVSGSIFSTRPQNPLKGAPLAIKLARMTLHPASMVHSCDVGPCIAFTLELSLLFVGIFRDGNWTSLGRWGENVCPFCIITGSNGATYGFHVVSGVL